MMMAETELLARVQFAFTVSFHIIFPTISIGLAAFLAIVEGLWLKTKNPLYMQIYRFWLGIFAMSFGVGVVTGIVLSFEFGLGFARFAQIAGPAIGPMIALEVLTAFFLEAGFLGIMLFGLNRVGPKLHFFATCMVALGTLLSASWIMSANSWMQSPSGVSFENGRLVVTDWLSVIANPSWPYRLPHMLAAAYITGSFLVAGVGAWYLLRIWSSVGARFR
jgi:cytochrome bd ubiquinol oxidase subunit I